MILKDSIEALSEHIQSNLYAKEPLAIDAQLAANVLSAASSNKEKLGDSFSDDLKEVIEHFNYYTHHSAEVAKAERFGRADSTTHHELSDTLGVLKAKLKEINLESVVVKLEDDNSFSSMVLSAVAPKEEPKPSQPEKPTQRKSNAMKF